MSNTYYIWLDQDNKYVGKPDVYVEYKSLDWEKRPAKAVSVVRGTKELLVRHYGVPKRLFGWLEEKLRNQNG